MSKKNKARKDPPKEQPTPAEEKVTEPSAITEQEITSVSAENTEGADAEIKIDASEDPTPEPQKDKTKKKFARGKIDFVFCSKCGYQNPDSSINTCPTCKNDLEPAYSSNPN